MVRKVAWNDGRWTLLTSSERLTLQTCTSYYSTAAEVRGGRRPALLTPHPGAPAHGTAARATGPARAARGDRHWRRWTRARLAFTYRAGRAALRDGAAYATTRELGPATAVIRRHLMALRLGLMAVDGATATVVFLLVSIARFGDGEWMEIWNRLGIEIRLAAVLFGLAWVAALWFVGLYRLRTRWRFRSEAVDILRATILVAALTLSALFIFKQEDVSRLFLVHPVHRPAAGHPRHPGRAAGVVHPPASARPQHPLHAGGGDRPAGPGVRRQGRGPRRPRDPGHRAPRRPRRDAPATSASRSWAPSTRSSAIFHERVVDEVAVCLEPDALRYLDPVARLAADEGKVVRVPDRPRRPAAARTPARRSSRASSSARSSSTRSTSWGWPSSGSWTSRARWSGWCC